MSLDRPHCKINQHKCLSVQHDVYRRKFK
uniref:Uncharacterized protein n=1 Tax=Arundo donax TaxID=35708 RepID=A0A0A8Y6N7_ARUDO